MLNYRYCILVVQRLSTTIKHPAIIFFVKVIKTHFYGK